MQVAVALCAAMLQCSNPLIMSVATLLCSSNAPEGAQPSLQIQLPASDSTWRLTALRDGRFRAEQRTSTDVVAPVFSSVELRRLIGPGEVTCALFQEPALVDNGVERVWVYETQRPASGPCVDRDGREFVAVGRRGDVEVRSAPVP